RGRTSRLGEAPHHGHDEPRGPGSRALLLDARRALGALLQQGRRTARRVLAPVVRTSTESRMREPRAARRAVDLPLGGAAPPRWMERGAPDGLRPRHARPGAMMNLERRSWSR